MDAPSVTIGIVTKDRPAFLREALESAYQQTVPAGQVLVVDDGSGAETQELLQTFSAKHFNFRAERNSVGGRSHARNKLVSCLGTDFLLWLDDDDALAPHALESHLAKLRDCPQAEVLYGDLIVCDEALSPKDKARKSPLHSHTALLEFFKRAPVPNGSAMIRRDVFERVGPYNPDFVRGQDYEFFARAASCGVRFVHNPDLIYYYRSHSDNSVTTERLRENNPYRRRIMLELLERHGMEQLFPTMPWQDAPSKAVFHASVEVVSRLLRVNGLAEALSHLQKVQAGEYQPLVQFMIELLNSFQSSGLEKVNSFRSSDFYFAYVAQLLIETYIDAYESEAAHDEFRRSYIGQRLEKGPIEELYPELNWAEAAEDALLEAVVDLASQFIEAGGFEEAKEALNQGVTPKTEQEAYFLLELVNLFIKGGFKALSELEQEPFYYSVLARRLSLAFGKRELRKREKKLERELTTTFESTGEANLGRLGTGTQITGQFASSVSEFPKILASSLPLFEEAVGLLSGKLSPDLCCGSLESDRPCSVEFRPEALPADLKISVVIPTYNRPDVLQEAVQSVVSQNGGPYEIVVVNDAGSELPLDELKRFSSADRPLSVISHFENKKLAGARNTGAKYASGRWLLFLDDDDVLLQNALRNLYDSANTSAADFVYGAHIRQHYSRGLPVEHEFRAPEAETLAKLATENPVMCGSFLVKRSALAKLGGYREDMCVHEDYNLHIRVAKLGAIESIKQPVAVYNHRPHIERLTLDKRLYWYATSALNHALFSRLFPVTQQQILDQIVNRYYHLLRAQDEGALNDHMKELVLKWWELLDAHGLNNFVQTEQQIVQSIVPNLAPRLLG